MSTLKNVTGLNIATPYTITIGCDPEFEVRDGNNNKVSGITAYNIIHEGRSNSFTEARIGLDGNSRTLELRPLPNEDEKKVVDNIRDLIVKISEHGYILDTTGSSEPLGGHIHIGIDSTVVRTELQNHRNMNNLVMLFDDFLGRQTLPLSGAARRGYRRLGQWRTQNWGIEYRTPPAALFHNPIMMELSLRIIKRLTELFLNGTEITYSTPPKQVDYFNLGLLNKEEYNLFKKMVSALRKKKKEGTLTSIWGVKAPIKNHINIIFKDEWNLIQRDWMAAGLKESLKDVSLNGRTIILYGLNKSRGDVATIPIEGVEIADVRYPHDQETSIAIGLSYYMRRVVNASIAEKIVNSITEEVKRVCV